ncbi:hypothetical protein [Moorena sp. SIO3A2]|nr:hypothetical protein [Moorena sp. SIO3A2]
MANAPRVTYGQGIGSHHGKRTFEDDQISELGDEGVILTGQLFGA